MSTARNRLGIPVYQHRSFVRSAVTPFGCVALYSFAVWAFFNISADSIWFPVIYTGLPPAFIGLLWIDHYLRNHRSCKRTDSSRKPRLSEVRRVPVEPAVCNPTPRHPDRGDDD